MSSPPSLSPLSLQHNGQSSQSHSTRYQPHQTQWSGSYPFAFPLRVIPPGYDKHPGPRPPLKAYKQAQRWIHWQSDPNVAGFWRAEWRKLPSYNDVSLLVEEMVLRGILPKCFSTDAGDQEEAITQIKPFNNGAHNDLYTLHCRCCPASKEEQAAEACSSLPVPSQTCSKVESQKLLNSSSPHTSPSYRSTLLQHGGGGGGVTGVEEDKFDDCHIPEEILLRLSLPLDPYFHTESDVATAHFARVRGIPVPRIYAYDSSAVNCLGIEWQLVQKIPDPDVNFVDEILDEEEEFLAACGSDQPRGLSTAWMRLGRQLEETLALLRSGNYHPYRGREYGACFDKIGSLYWDFEECDFVLGPVSDRCFTRGRRILYHQRHDGDSGDPKLPLHRGPFDSVGEYLNAALTMYLEESKDENLRVDKSQPNLSTSPAPSEAGSITATTTAVTDRDCSPRENDDPPRLWYTRGDVEIVRDQVSKLRDIVIPWLVAKLTPEQQGQMRTYISHPDLHSQNLVVSRRAQTQLDSDVASVNILGEEYAISAVLDWEHTVALPDYFIHPVDIARYFNNALPIMVYPAFSGVAQIQGYLEDALDGGRAARSLWRPGFEIPGRFAPEGLVPWRGGYGSREDGIAAASAGSCVDGCGGKFDGVRVGASDMGQREATTNSFMTPPRQLTNAEVLLFIVFDCLDGSVGSWSEELVNPLVEWIQAHSTSEGNGTGAVSKVDCEMEGGQPM